MFRHPQDMQATGLLQWVCDETTYLNRERIGPCNLFDRRLKNERSFRDVRLQYALCSRITYDGARLPMFKKYLEKFSLEKFD